MYEHFPSFVPDFFADLYDDVTDKCIRFPIKMYGKTFESRRRSCVFSDSEDMHSYSVINTYDWSESPLIEEIRKKVEGKVGTTFDYVLVHIYEDGNDYIGYHNDSEALESTVASVSFGATRKFRLRKIRDAEGKLIKKGWEAEYLLSTGDLFVMYGPSENHLGCQQIYKHSIPKLLRVKEPRVNLTFRKRIP